MRATFIYASYQTHSLNHPTGIEITPPGGGSGNIYTGLYIAARTDPCGGRWATDVPTATAAAINWTLLVINHLNPFFLNFDWENK